MTKTIKVYLSEGETGHAEIVGPDTVRILNVPLGGSLNFGDVVEVTEVDRDLPEPVRLVSRIYPYKSVVRYDPPTQATYDILSTTFRLRGWVLEGGVDGLALLAHDGSDKPSKVLSRAGTKGVKVTDYLLPNDGGLGRSSNG